MLASAPFSPSLECSVGQHRGLLVHNLGEIELDRPCTCPARPLIAFMVYIQPDLLTHFNLGNPDALEFAISRTSAYKETKQGPVGNLSQTNPHSMAKCSLRSTHSPQAPEGPLAPCAEPRPRRGHRSGPARTPDARSCSWPARHSFLPML